MTMRFLPPDQAGKITAELIRNLPAGSFVVMSVVGADAEPDKDLACAYVVCAEAATARAGGWVTPARFPQLPHADALLRRILNRAATLLFRAVTIVAVSRNQGTDAIYALHARWLTEVLGPGDSLFTPGTAGLDQGSTWMSWSVRSSRTRT